MSEPISPAPSWLPSWLLSMVALWPLPGIAEAVLTLGALALALQLGLRRLRGRPPTLHPRLALLCGALFLGYWLPQLLAAPDALDRGRAWGEVVTDLRYLPFLWAVALSVVDAGPRRRVFLGLAALVCVWTLDALAQVAIGTSPWFWTLDTLKQLAGGAPLCSAQESLSSIGRLTGALGPCNPRIGIVLASLSPFALWGLAQRWGHIGWALGALALGVVILLAGARASWLTYALVLACSAWQRFGWRRLLLPALLCSATVAGLVAVSPPLQQRVEATAQVLSGDAAGVDAALAGRLRIWQASLCMIQAHPVNGVGPRGFRVAWPACDPSPGQMAAWGDGGAFHAHQLVLELLAETGVLGLLLWIAAAAVAWRAWWRASPQARQAAHPAMLALASALFPFNTHLAVYSTFWGGVVLLLAGLYAGSIALGQDADGG